MGDFFEDLVDLVTIHVFALEKVREELFYSLDSLNKEQRYEFKVACLHELSSHPFILNFEYPVVNATAGVFIENAP
jgi:hypothetical protein